MSQWKGYDPANVRPSDGGATEPGPRTAGRSAALTYEPFYGLEGKPFSLSTDPRFLYKSSNYASVLDDLVAALRRREGLIVLTGEMGTGKTTLCRAALYQLDRKTFTSFVPDPFLSREDLLRTMLVDFGEMSVEEVRRGRLAGAARSDLSHQLSEFLSSLESVDAFAVLIIEESQHLSGPLIEEIRALFELEAGRRLLQIVLIGQPELTTRLKEPELRQIDQRVTMRCDLRALTKEDVANYVAHRLSMAGGTSERIAFAPAAIEMIHSASSGVPRVVNVICDRALSRGHVQRTSVIDGPMVSSAIGELKLSPAPAPTKAIAVVPHPPAPAPRQDIDHSLDRARLIASSVSVSMPVSDELVFAPVHQPRSGVLRTAGLAVLAMMVMIVTGGLALIAQPVRPAVAPRSPVRPLPIDSIESAQANRVRMELAAEALAAASDLAVNVTPGAETATAAAAAVTPQKSESREAPASEAR